MARKYPGVAELKFAVRNSPGAAGGRSGMVNTTFALTPANGNTLTAAADSTSGSPLTRSIIS